MGQYELGLVSVSFRKNTPEEILSKMQKTGLTCIEWGSDIHAPKDDKDQLLHLKHLQEKYRITCSSYGTYFRLGKDPIEELFSYITAARLLGTSVLRLWCGNKNSEDYSEEERAELMDACKEAAKIAQKEQVIFCMECHGNTYTNTKESALELIKTVNSPFFRMYWQPDQFRSEEENLSSAELLSAYTQNIHVFHWKEYDRYPLKDSIPAWKSYINCFQNKHTLLLEFMPDDQLDSLEEEAKALAIIAGQK